MRCGEMPHGLNRSGHWQGDDYELCFTAPRSARENIVDMAHRIGIPVSRIGQVEAAHTGTVVLDTHGQPMPIERTGFDHFATS